MRRRHVAALVGREPGRRVRGAAQQRAEELVQSREQLVLVRGRAVGGEVFLERLGAAVVEEVEGDGNAFAVRGLQCAVEVGEQVDGGAVEGAVGEDAGDGVLGGGGCGVVAWWELLERWGMDWVGVWWMCGVG